MSSVEDCTSFNDLFKEIISTAVLCLCMVSCKRMISLRTVKRGSQLYAQEEDIKVRNGRIT